MAAYTRALFPLGAFSTFAFFTSRTKKRIQLTATVELKDSTYDSVPYCMILYYVYGTHTGITGQLRTG